MCCLDFLREFVMVFNKCQGFADFYVFSTYVSIKETTMATGGIG